MIHLTESAVKKIFEIAEAEGIGHQTVRVKVVGGGCAGFQHDMSFEEVVQETDEVIEQDGVKIIIDPISFQYLDETVIDWHEALIGAGFKFNSPKATGSCGCGKSVQY